MTHSKEKLKSSGDKASPSFRPFWIGKLPEDVYLYGLYYTFSLNTF
jgi:hypothetical protein